MSRLSRESILQGMADALPTHAREDESSDLASSYEAIALLVHAYLAAIGFRLQGFDEDKKIPEAESLAPRLPPSWNTGFGSLSFVYQHKQSAMSFAFRIDRMGGKVEVRGLAVGDDNIHRFEKTVRDVVTSSALPVRITLNENGEEDRSDLVDKLSKVFTSEEAVNSILHDLKVNIVQKLIPKLQSEGYIEEAETEANANAERRNMEDYPARGGRQPQPHDPTRPFPGFNPEPDLARPRAPQGDMPMPGFDDEHEILRDPRAAGFPGRTPYNIGHDDLNPPGLGSHDPLRPSFGGGGFGGLPRPGGGAGMHPTFDDPLFTGQGSAHPGGPGQGYDPQAPPGARWDPLGPGGNPRFPGPGRGQGGNFGGFGPGGGDII